MTEEELEKRRAYAREYRKKNPDRVRGYAKRYREANPEKVRQSERCWREAHREHVRAYKAKRESVRVDARYWLIEPVGLAAKAAGLRWSALHWEQVAARETEAVRDSHDEQLTLLSEVWALR